MSLLGAALSPPIERYALLKLSPQKQKQKEKQKMLRVAHQPHRSAVCHRMEVRNWLRNKRSKQRTLEFRLLRAHTYIHPETSQQVLAP